MTGVSALPSGTVTFLFTDIERSTETVAQVGDHRYADLLAELQRLSRAAFAAHGGYEVDTEGDAFFVAFASANDAVFAAVDLQRAVDSFEWPGEGGLRVRIGLHTGEALVREGDYVGHDVHKAKRICDAGHGGQVLLSQTTADLVSKAVSLLDLGPHRLKDLGEPQCIFQVLDPDLERDFPSLRSLETFRHNLPPQRTTFVGRGTELAQLRAMLEREALVTLTGVGGVGKTRLAVQVGAEVLDRFGDGVYFVDLAALADPDAIPQAIAEAVGLSLASDIGTGPAGSTDERVIAHLTTRTCLLILDNCEHLLDPCAALVDRLLASCPRLTVLATSREALDVEGEQSWRLPSLSLPGGGHAQDSEAVSLFKARAVAVQPDFDLTPANVGVVADICRRLDGIPLAIELAASRISHLTPEEIAARLGDMFQLLAGGRRRRVQRQQTLQATLDWSYELLDETDKTLLRRLAVFPGPFTLEAAEGICAVDGLVARQTLDRLGSLVAKSLVTPEAQSGTTRYRLMETVRQYAGEKLREADESDRFRARHRDWYLESLVAISSGLTGPRRSWLLRDPVHSSVSSGVNDMPGEMLTDYPNYAAALERSVDEGRIDLVVKMACRLMVLWAGYGHLEAGHRLLTLARPEDLDLTIEEKVSALTQLAYLTNVLQLPGAMDYADRAIEVAGDGTFVQLIRSYGQRAFLLAIRSQATGDRELALAARAALAESERVAKEAPQDTATIGVAFLPSGEALSSRLVMQQRVMLELILGDYPAAFAAVEHLDVGKMSEISSSAAVAAHLAGEIEVGGKVARLDHVRFMTARKGGHPIHDVHIAAAIVSAAPIAASGDLELARQVLVDILDAAVTSGRSQGAENLAIAAAAIAYCEGDYARASRLLSWIRSRTLDLDQIFVSAAAWGLYKHYVALLREALPAEESRRYRAEGRALSLDEAIAEALGTERSGSP